jgi:hypothetical protein
MTAAESVALRTASGVKEPASWVLLVIFWLAFAAAAIAAHVLNPGLFQRQDPDSLMRLVQVRDLLAGQAWFDLVQHRLNPPDGISMHWSRLIDAPLAALVLLGSLFGDGEAFALAAWPLLLLLGLMASSVCAATALAGRPAALPALILALTSFAPLLSFLPTSIDHHNAQLTLLIAILALSLRLRSHPLSGLAAGLSAAVSIAIGLEMLPYVTLIGAFIALEWAFTGDRARGTLLFGLGLGIGPVVLTLVAASPQAAMACDSLSWSYALPAAAAGCGLGALTTIFGAPSRAALRLAGLALVACATAATFLLVAPECLAGPYGELSPELKALWLSTIAEAQPLLAFAVREPVSTIGALGAPLVALVVAIRRAWLRTGEDPLSWSLAAALTGLALAMSFWQVRTLPGANALAVPVLGAWLAEVAARHRIHSLRPLRRALPLIAACLAAMPLAHLAAGWAAVRAVSLATGIEPIARPDVPAEAVAGLTPMQRDCLDESARRLLAQVPTGQVLAPVFYGPTVLALSSHSAVAGPYHRGGAAILDATRAMGRPPDTSRAIATARGIDYVAICTSSRESAINRAEAPDGLLARLMDGETIAWLEPVPAQEPTTLRLWRVSE